MTVTEAASLLKLSLPATRSQIKKAFHTIARRWHPDLNPGSPSAHARMVAANEAFEVLINSLPPTPKGVMREKKVRPFVNREPLATHRVVWSGPPTAVSEFFEQRGFLVRPTDGFVAFRIMKDGRHMFMLERHRDDPAILFCRNDRGGFETIDGVAFWLDTGASIIPYTEGSV